MTRAQINTLSSLVDNAEAGGWTLPADVLQAHRIYRQVSALDLEPPAGLDAYTAAAKIVDSVAAGERVDLLAAGRELRLADEERQAYEKAKGNSKLGWEKAKHATRAAWDRVERAIPGDSDRDGK